MAWKPPGAAPDFHDVLVPGLPPWMRNSLNAWFDEYVGDDLHQLANMFDVAARRWDLLSEHTDYGYAGLVHYADEPTFFAFLDYLIYLFGTSDIYGQRFCHPDAVDALDYILSSCGSEWCVGQREGLVGLEKRVSPGVQEAANVVMAQRTSAGQLLSEAWHAAFGRSPDAEEAYEKAIKAVEEAAIPLVEPKNTVATLGTVINVMRNQEDWALELVDKRGNVFPGTILGMLEVLWRGQPSRHGANGYRKPTGREAEAAVLLAVPLVHWFSTEAIMRREIKAL